MMTLCIPPTARSTTASISRGAGARSRRLFLSLFLPFAFLFTADRFIEFQPFSRAGFLWMFPSQLRLSEAHHPWMLRALEKKRATLWGPCLCFWPARFYPVQTHRSLPVTSGVSQYTPSLCCPTFDGVYHPSLLVIHLNCDIGLNW